MNLPSAITRSIVTGGPLEPLSIVRSLTIVLTVFTFPGWAATPALNSDYRAPHVLYLDFDGHYELASNYHCPDGRPAGWTIDFSTTDVSGRITAAEVRQIWQAVAEDFAPFHVNVTTDPRFEPDPESQNAVRVAIGDSSLDLLGVAPAVCGESLLDDPPYLNADISNVALVNVDPYAIRPMETAKKISHEAGHIYGLAHHTAPGAAIDDWIMAPIRSATRFVWRSGPNEDGRAQHDINHLAGILGRRQDEAQPSSFRSTGPSINPGDEISYVHGTLASTSDWDDYVFTPPREGILEFRVSPGIWASPLNPVAGAEPNARYEIVIVNQSGRQTLVCPTGQTFTMEVVSRPSLGLDCLNYPPALQVGTTYRLRVFHGGPTTLPGNVGRYTLTVRDVTPRPALPQPIPRFR